MDKIRCIVTYAKPYSMADEKTGVVNEGISIQYLLTDEMTPFNEGQEKGYKFCRDSISLDKSESIKEVPAVYDLHFRYVPNGQGKPVMRLSKLEFVQPIQLKVK